MLRNTIDVVFTHVRDLLVAEDTQFIQRLFDRRADSLYRLEIVAAVIDQCAGIVIIFLFLFLFVVYVIYVIYVDLVAVRFQNIFERKDFRKTDFLIVVGRILRFTVVNGIIGRVASVRQFFRIKDGFDKSLVRILQSFQFNDAHASLNEVRFELIGLFVPLPKFFNKRWQPVLPAFERKLKFLDTCFIRLGILGFGRL
jgi:hypothetical protein